jgi:hypothetical protein
LKRSAVRSVPIADLRACAPPRRLAELIGKIEEGAALTDVTRGCGDRADNKVVVHEMLEQSD